VAQRAAQNTLRDIFTVFSTQTFQLLTSTKDA
jgi:hypothetical protein